MTPSEINNQARQRYNAVGDNFFSDEMIYSLIWQAENELFLAGYQIENSYETTSVADQREYTYPTNTVAIKRIEYDGLEITNVALKDDPKGSTTEPTGTPDSYAIWDDVIYMYPTPDTTGDTIKLFTYDRPAEVTATSTLATPKEHHIDIIDFVLSGLFAKDKDQVMAAYHRNLWLEAVDKCVRNRAKRKRTDKMARVRDYEELPYKRVLHL